MLQYIRAFFACCLLCLLAGCCAEPEPKPRRNRKITAVPSQPAAPVIQPPAKPSPFKDKVFVNTIDMKLVRLEPGQFAMGMGEQEDAEEHQAEITQPFFIGKYEVTQAEYEAVMGDNPSARKGPRLPVESVTWDQAMKFCETLSKKEDRDYRLPTEAEWEYACRAGTKTAFSFGDTLMLEQANFDADKNPRRRIIEVGKLEANPWGLYDMHGNVWEWCADWYADNYYKASPKQDPPGPTTGKERVLRGGSFTSVLKRCASAYRDNAPPNTDLNSIGFRVVLRIPAEFR